MRLVRSSILLALGRAGGCGAGKQERAGNGAGKGAIESPLAVNVSVDTATDLHHQRWNACIGSKQIPSLPTKGCKHQAQTFPLLKRMGMPTPGKNTNTQGEKKNHCPTLNLAEHSHQLLHELTKETS